MVARPGGENGRSHLDDRLHALPNFTNRTCAALFAEKQGEALMGAQKEKSARAM